MTNANEMNTTGAIIHPWERAGLGPAPYRFSGFSRETYQACPGAPIQPGTSCDYCGTGIVDTFWITAANGARFKVGSDCIRRLAIKCATTSEKRAIANVLAGVRKVAREATHARQDAKIEEGRRLVQAPAVRATLAAKPHPVEWRAARGETLLDSITWGLANGGRAGKCAAARYIAKIAKAEGVPADFVPSPIAEEAPVEPAPAPPAPAPAAPPAEVLVAAPVGDSRVTFVGVVVSVKARDGYAFGTVEYKMTVKVRDAATGETWLAWGTAPRAILGTVESGNRVRVTARLKAGRDPHFAIMDRPSAEILAAEEA